MLSSPRSAARTPPEAGGNMTAITVLFAIGILIGAFALTLDRDEKVRPILVARFTVRLVMFPFQLLHEITGLVYFRVYELITGHPFQVCIEDMREETKK
jgi:hypothetical protein